MQGYVNSIETMGLVDGPGIRVVIFLDGCPARCIYCHNPETWVSSKENLTTVEEIITTILKYKTYFENNGGVTFSGGEPLFQPEFLKALLKRCYEEGIHTCLDTCGIGNTEYESILEYVDLVIMDIKATNEKSYKEITGVGIEPSLKFINTCQKLNKKMWLRSVVIPTINDNTTHMDELSEIINELKNIEKVELLPYHDMGVSKYDKLGIPYKLKGIPPMDKKKCEELSKYLHSKLKI